MPAFRRAADDAALVRATRGNARQLIAAVTKDVLTHSRGGRTATQAMLVSRVNEPAGGR